MPRYTLGDVHRLVNKRVSFQAASVTAMEHYPKGAFYSPVNSNAWPSVRIPEIGVLYVIYSWDTAVAWIDELGIAWTEPKHFSSRTSQHMSCFRLEDDPVEIVLERQRILGLPKQQRRTIEKAREERREMYHNDVQVYRERKREQDRDDRRHAARRRYWTPERRFLKEAAPVLAESLGISQRAARKILQDSEPGESSADLSAQVAEAVALLTGRSSTGTRDAGNIDDPHIA